jgi:hypothetical protein
LTLFVLLLSAFGETTDVTTTSWAYSKHEDEMGQGTEKLAKITSLNVANFCFPNQDGHANLFLRKSPNDGKDVIFRIERGQFASSSVQNFVTARFDGGELQTFFVIGDSADGGGDVLFIRHYDQFVNQLRKARTLEIEANFYLEGSRVFEFDVHGLRGNW